jgi:hypothetical protein
VAYRAAEVVLMGAPIQLTRVVPAGVDVGAVRYIELIYRPPTLLLSAEVVVKKYIKAGKVFTLQYAGYPSI